MLLGPYNVNITCDWLSHGGPPLQQSFHIFWLGFLPGLNRVRKRMHMFC